MKNKKVFITSLLTIGILGVGAISASAYMCNYQDKAEILSELTGKSTNEIIEERITEDKTYGTIAIENGVLAEFKDKNLEQMKDTLNEKIEDGSISKEKADNILNNKEKQMLNCDGSGAKQGKNKGNKAQNCTNSNCYKNN